MSSGYPVGRFAQARPALLRFERDIPAKPQVPPADVKGQSLLDAIFKKDTAAMDKLLNDAETNLNFETYRDTPMIAAVRTGQLDVVEMLYRKGVQVNAVNSKSYGFPLLAAMSSELSPEQREAAVLKLLALNADPNTSNGRDETALLRALNQGMVSVTKKLLEVGADPNKPCRGVPPLHVAIQAQQNAENIELVDALLAKGAALSAKSDRGDTVLHAATRSSPQMVRHLIAKGASVNGFNKDMETPLFQALTEGNLAVAKVLHENGARMDFKNRSSFGMLFAAASSGRLDAVQWVMAQDTFNPDDKMEIGRSFAASVFSGNREMMELLLPFKPNVNMSMKEMDSMQGGMPDMTPLVMALMEINAFGWAIEPLLKAGANPNWKSFLMGMNTADMLFNGPAESDMMPTEIENVISLLLDYGLDPNSKLSEGTPILFRIACSGSPALFDKVVAAGGDIKARDRHGNNLCLFAAKHGFVDVVQKMKRLGVEIHQKNIREMATAMDLAVAGLQTVKANKYLPNQKDWIRNFEETIALLDRYQVPTTPQAVQRILTRNERARYGYEDESALGGFFDGLMRLAGI